MDLIIVNKSSQMPIQSYVELSDESGNKDPQMSGLSRENIIVTGETAADVRLSIDGEYIYFGVWKGDGDSVDSWLVIKREDGSVSESQMNNFGIDVDKNDYQFVATVSDRKNSGSSGNMQKGLLITGIVVISLIFLAFIAWLIFS